MVSPGDLQSFSFIGFSSEIRLTHARSPYLVGMAGGHNIKIDKPLLISKTDFTALRMGDHLPLLRCGSCRPHLRPDLGRNCGNSLDRFRGSLILSVLEFQSNEKFG